MWIISKILAFFEKRKQAKLDILEAEKVLANKKKDFVLVLQHKSTWCFNNRFTGDLAEEFHLYYNLYENALGDRKYELLCDSKTDSALEQSKVRDEFYITKLLPWVNGVIMLDIDTYEEARAKLFVEKLKK